MIRATLTGLIVGVLAGAAPFARALRALSQDERAWVTNRPTP